MDLSQAEAVADVIASTSRAAHQVAMSQMRGGFSRELTALRDRLLHFASLMELELDFSDHEDLEFADRSELLALAEEIEGVIGKLASSYRAGNVIKNGVPVAIVGETNAGKSTLLNALLGEERAIVSEMHGTTRDVIEDTVTLDGVMFRFIDTAGLRQTTDVVENMGIGRTYEKWSKPLCCCGWWTPRTSRPPHACSPKSSREQGTLPFSSCSISATNSAYQSARTWPHVSRA